MDGRLRYYIDGSANHKNWMKFVSCARHAAEQNLVLVQQECSLYYEATRVITEGEELKVWYGDGYSVFMGIPLGIKSGPEGELCLYYCDGTRMLRCKYEGEIFMWILLRIKNGPDNTVYYRNGQMIIACLNVRYREGWKLVHWSSA